MDRREFVRAVLLWTAGMGLAPRWTVTPAVAAAEPPLVAVVTGRDYRLLVATAVEELGGIGAFVESGMRVVIKPNIGWDRSPEQGANTHPLVVRALAELALDAGAAQVQVFDHTCNEKRRCYTNSGIIAALEAIGDRRVRWEHIDERKFVPVAISRGLSLREWPIYQDALTADCYINVPVAKHHGLSRLTLGLKNVMGVLGGSRGRLHHDLGQQLADLATVLRPQLTLIDATRMLLRNGPQGGRLEDVQVADTVVAATDPVAADAYATTLFGLRPEEIDSTVAAHRLGLGEMAVEKMRLRQLTV
jgi:uncharacterized protein (DUF362 family)